MIIPPALQPGDTIGIVAPTLPMSDDKIAVATKRLQALGFKVALHPACKARHGGFAGTDAVRAAALLDYLQDDTVAAIMFMGGFYGSGRLLDHVGAAHHAALRARPKLLIGYSDTNFLLYHFVNTCDVLALHGPLFSSFAKDPVQAGTATDFKSLVMQLGQPQKIALPGQAMQVGTVTGRLVPCNLAILQAMIGTPEDPFTDGCILCLEETADEIDSIERSLIQLQRMGRLARAGAILFGDMYGLRPAHYDYPDTLAGIYRRVLPPGKIAAFDLPFGHGPRNASLPIGVTATVTVAERRVEISF